MEFTKVGFDLFRADVKAALEEVAKKHEVTINPGKITYSNVDFSMKLEVAKANSGIDVQKDKFESICILYGFSKEDYKREFTLNGKTFQLIGFNTRSPKNNCNIYCITDGKTYKCNDSVIKKAIA